MLWGDFQSYTDLAISDQYCDGRLGALHVDPSPQASERVRGRLQSAQSALSRQSIHVPRGRATFPDRTFVPGAARLTSTVCSAGADSTGGRNILVFLQRWSVSHEVSHADVLHRGTKIGDVGSMAAWRVVRFDRPKFWARVLVKFSPSGTHGRYQPPARVRSRIALTLREREEVSRGLAAGLTLSAIAHDLARAPSTVSGEVGRNGGRKTIHSHAVEYLLTFCRHDDGQPARCPRASGAKGHLQVHRA
ncbi:helix-turn-helix domain-containing protein [Paracoccus sp. SM22M-07]|uniref:helix-turn-helix domain-containing protein n=1 Tax=Paracoccus sp. SM22M-07 TaxID=1520813 RepID=UPI0009FB8136